MGGERCGAAFPPRGRGFLRCLTKKLVHAYNAGISNPDWFEDEGPERFRRMVDYHYFGTVHVCRAAWPHLKAAGRGSIVNTTSEAITGFVPKTIGYAGAKGAVFAFTRALAQDARRFGIRVNAVAPRGYTRGGQVLRLALIETAGITVGAAITPEDIAGNLDTLMDPASAHVVGIDM